MRQRISDIYLLSIVLLVGIVQQADKNLFSAALQPIKNEFHLSDSQLGAINGPAYALLFGMAGIPIARLAERNGRCRVVAISIVAWSIFTSATALATGFLGLFVSRLLVGVGESGTGPAIQSLLAARFALRSRAGAMSVMYAGSYLGIFVGLALGGVLVESFGWRTAFVCLGTFGLLIAPLVFFLMEEPPSSSFPVGETLFDDVMTVLRTPGVLHFLAMFCLMGLAMFATTAWAPAFYSRHYGMDVGRAGAVIGGVIGGGAMFGSLLGGALVSRLNRWRASEAPFVLWTLLLAIPAAIGAFTDIGLGWSLFWLSFSIVLSCLPAGAIYAILHTLVEPRHRGIAAAVATLMANLVGGLGPFLAGLISDIAGTQDRDGLQIALLGINGLYVWAIGHTLGVLRIYQHKKIAS